MDNKQKILDLHGFTRDEALRELEDFLFYAKQDNDVQVEVITGRGSHSPEGVPVLKHAVIAYLNSNSFSYSENDSFFTGGGSVFVFL